MPEEKRILAVDPGEKRIGIAICDPTMTIASPLAVLNHRSLVFDAAQIGQIATEKGAIAIIIGQALGCDGEETPSSRHARKLADAIHQVIQVPIILWDESGSTQSARQAKIELGLSRARRSGHLDEYAAVVILQSYLDERCIK